MTSIHAEILAGDTRMALANLRRHLTEDGTFGVDAIGHIVAYVREHGIIDGAPFVRDDEIDALTAIYIGSFRQVNYDDPLWSMDDGHYVSNDVVPTETVVCQFFMLEEPALPPLAGGCDDLTPPYEPTEEDWREYHLIMDEVDAREMRAWYDRHPLSEINDQRTDV